MGGNLLLEQYGRFKKAELEESPFRCLLNTNIEINPHQINAFCAAIQALKTGGIVLADEVGLGKTIEAGLTLKYVLDSGAKHVLIALPATLRKQWEVELEEKFNLQASILDRLTVESNLSFWKACLENRDEVRIVITSYDYSSKLMQRFPKVKWDFIIIDEAHNLRNVFHGTKRAKRLYELSKGIPKILLTATPLQNSLSDLHGLISFIDPRIFGSEKVFNKRFIEGQDYTELKRELIPVLYRTLRRDVGKYMDFKKRECRTIDFVLSPDEVELYMRVNNFLKKDVLYSIPNANKGLIVLVIRKLLASSSYALIETFEVLKNRLQKLYEGTKSANAQDGFDLFWNFVEDEIDESGFEEIDDEDTLFQKQQIQVEIDEVDAIIETASRIQSNAKVKALKTAIHTAFEYQEKQNIPQKVVVFTESKRTQKYIASELRKDGFEEDDILLFNGDFNDAMTKEIYRAWQVKNFGKTNYGRSVEYKWLAIPSVKALSRRYEECYEEFCNAKGWTLNVKRNATYVLMHTFAHLLIKQMSMTSGYSSSAIRERIYFSEKMTGILLYTGSADKEGSLGGLVELGNIGKLVPLMKDAFQEALLCTNDPECMSNAPAGNNLNGAACHSCCMISETACENGNRMLDRGLVVPIACRERESYFRELVCELCQLEM